MNDVAHIDIFAEDHAHEAFLRAVVTRFGRENGIKVHIKVRNGRGGHGRAMAEFKLFQRAVLKQIVPPTEMPDIMVVAIDANCQQFQKARTEIEKAVAPELQGRVVIACPDPHIEKWFLADPVSFYQVVGRQPRSIRAKCERDLYKKVLAETIRGAGHPLIFGGVEFAEDLVNVMDFYRAGKNDRSLQTFISELNRQMSKI